MDLVLVLGLCCAAAGDVRFLEAGNDALVDDFVFGKGARDLVIADFDPEVALEHNLCAVQPLVLLD